MRPSYIWLSPWSETEMRERIRPRQRGATSRRSALNSAIKTPAHVYYFILVPGPPRLKRIHNYRCLREPLNLSRAPARTSLIYACVDFNSHAAISGECTAHHWIVRAHRPWMPCVYLSPGPRQELSASSCDERSRYARHESRSAASVFARRLESEIAPPPINRAASAHFTERTCIQSVRTPLYFCLVFLWYEYDVLRDIAFRE